MYRTAVQPQRITRLAVRYINRLELPLPIAELKDYLRTSPEVSSALPQNLAGYFMHLTIPLPDIKSTVMLTETPAASPDPKVVSIILDIDLFRSLEIPSTEEELWDLFEVLRVRKNDVFEACITDRTRESFQSCHPS